MLGVSYLLKLPTIRDTPAAHLDESKVIFGVPTYFGDDRVQPGGGVFFLEGAAKRVFLEGAAQLCFSLICSKLLGKLHFQGFLFAASYWGSPIFGRLF